MLIRSLVGDDLTDGRIVLQSAGEGYLKNIKGYIFSSHMGGACEQACDDDRVAIIIPIDQNNTAEVI